MMYTSYTKVVHWMYVASMIKKHAIVQRAFNMNSLACNDSIENTIYRRNTLLHSFKASRKNYLKLYPCNILLHILTNNRYTSQV
jgi:hypothetical protein